MKGFALATVLLLSLSTGCCPDFQKFDGDWTGTVRFHETTCVPDTWPVDVSINMLSQSSVTGLIDVDAPTGCLNDQAIIAGGVDPGNCGILHLTLQTIVTTCDWEISAGNTQLDGFCTNPLSTLEFHLDK